MRLLDRYLVRELLVSSVLAVATLSSVLVFGQIFKKLFEYLIDHNLPASFIVTFIAYALPASLTLTIPWGFLTAVLLVFGRLSASNELTALRSHGISIPRIAVPVIVLALAFCGVCAWFNMAVAPRAQQNLKNAFFDVATRDPAAAFTGDQVITDFPGRKIYVGKKDGSRLEDLRVFEVNSAGQPTRVVFARRGLLETQLEEKRILMKLEDAYYEQRDAKKPEDLHLIRDGITAGDLPLPVDLEELYAKKQGRRRIESYSMGELLDEMRGKTVAPVQAKARPSARADASRRAGARTEFNRRISYSLACLTFALIGIPLGITAQRQETSLGFALSLIVAVSYYIIIIAANTLRERAGAHPELLIWLPNVLFLSVGAVLFYRLSRR